LGRRAGREGNWVHVPRGDEARLGATSPTAFASLAAHQEPQARIRLPEQVAGV